MRRLRDLLVVFAGLLAVVYVLVYFALFITVMLMAVRLAWLIWTEGLP